MNDMTLDEFRAKWDGLGIDFDQVYGDQCMDLMHQFCVEVLGITNGAVLAAPAAKDVYLNFNNVTGHELFDKVDNTPTGVPQSGDIIFWGTGIGPYGHVAIFIEGNVDNFRSFDQNFPTGSKCHVQNHPNYIGVLGWLRKKQSTEPTATITQKDLDQLRKDRDDNYNKYLAARNTITTLTDAVNQQKTAIEKLQKEILISDIKEDVLIEIQNQIKRLT